MTEENEIMLEIAKNKADKLLVKKELEREKGNFISEILNGMGDEITTSNNINKPVKFKKPFKVKWHEFKIKMKKTLGLS